jgi:hypothetical protein
MQEFPVDKTFRVLLSGCLVVFLSFVALGAALPFLPGEMESGFGATLRISLMCVVVFGSFSLLTWRLLRRLPLAAIVADDEGLWYRHAGREKGLVPWARIASIKERALLQRLDLLDSRETCLIRLEYQLQDFEILRVLLQARASLAGVDTRRRSFAKNPVYHLFYLGGIVGFFCLGLYLGSQSPVLVYCGTGIGVVALLHEYLVTVSRVEIRENALLVSTPLLDRSIAFEEIAAIDMADSHMQGNRYPEVWVYTRNRKKPFQLRQLGVDANKLLAVLEREVRRKAEG